MNLLLIADPCFGQTFAAACVPATGASALQCTVVSATAEPDVLVSVMKAASAVVYASALCCERDSVNLERLRQHLQGWCEACADADIPFVLLSSHHVFDQHKTTPYIELDPVCPVDGYGSWLVSLEELVRTQVSRHVILRTSWLYGPVGDNFVSRVLDRVRAGEDLVFDQGLSGCPTAVEDLARVLVAMFRQLLLGAPRWGTYHYCSSDVTNGYQFAEAILALARQYDQVIEQSPSTLSENGVSDRSLLPISPAVLSCRLLLNTFGIKQRPWRSYLPRTIQAIFVRG